MKIDIHNFKGIHWLAANSLYTSFYTTDILNGANSKLQSDLPPSTRKDRFSGKKKDYNTSILTIILEEYHLSLTHFIL